MSKVTFWHRILVLILMLSILATNIVFADLTPDSEDPQDPLQEIEDVVEDAEEDPAEPDEQTAENTEDPYTEDANDNPAEAEDQDTDPEADPVVDPDANPDADPDVVFNAGLPALTEIDVEQTSEYSGGILTWEITVNTERQSLYHVSVTGEAQDGGHAYLDLVSGSFTLDGEVQPDPDVTVYDNAAVFDMGDMDGQTATLQVRSKISDPEFIVRNTHQTFTHAVTVTGDDGFGGTVSGTTVTQAECVSDVLSMVPGEYDLQTNTMPWTVYVNMDSVNPFEHVAVTVNIPDGQALTGEVGVTNGDITISNGAFTAALGNIGGEPIVITYNTKLTEALLYTPEPSFQISCSAVMTSDYSAAPAVSASYTVNRPGIQMMNLALFQAASTSIYEKLVKSVDCYVDGTAITGTALQNYEIISYNHRLTLHLNINDLTGSELKTIRQGITDYDIYQYEIPNPQNLILAMNDTAETLTIVAGGSSYEVGTLYIKNGRAYFSFSGASNSVLSDAFANNYDLKNFWMEVTYKLDSSLINNKQDAVIDLYPFNGTKQYVIRIFENQPQAPSVVKTGVQNADGFLNWQAKIFLNDEAEISNIIFTDTLDSYHRLVADSIKVDGVPLPQNEVTQSGDTFSFTLSNTYNNDIEISYLTYLTTAAATYLYGGTTPPRQLDVTNTVTVKWGTPAKTATATAAITDVNLPYLTKEGKQIDGTNRIKWTVTVETYTQGFDYLYLFDELGDGLTYVNNTLKLNGSAINDTDIDWSTSSTPDKVMKIVLTESSGVVKLSGDSNGVFVFTYETEVNQNLLNNAFSKSYTNKAWLTFAWKGPGPYPVIPPKVTKTASFVPGLVIKKVSAFNHETGIITWTITVNSDKLDVTAITLKDIPYPKGSQTLLNDNAYACFQHDYVGYVNGSFKVDTVASQSNLLYNFKYDEIPGTISFENTGTAVVTLQIKTKVNDGDYVGANVTGTATQFRNKVNLEGNANILNTSTGLNESKAIKGNADVSYLPANSVLTKVPASADAPANNAGDYNYSNRSVVWAVTVNGSKNGPSLKNVVVTDTVKINCEIVNGANGVTVKVSDKNGNISVIRNTNYAVSYQAGTRKLTVDFKSYGYDLGGKTAVITYTTRATDNFTFTEPEFTLENNVEMTSEYTPTPRVTSTLTIPNKMLDKSAKAFYLALGRKDYLIHYTVKINQSQVPFPSGVVMVDTLDGLFDINLNTVKLYNASINSDGSFSEPTGNPLNISGVTLSKTSTQTLLYVPIPADTKACILEYDIVLYNYSGGNISNNISFTTQSPGVPAASSSNLLSFNQAAALGANASPRLLDLVTNLYFNLKVTKTDNSTNAPLEDVEFTLYEFTGSNPPSGNSSSITATDLKFITTVKTNASGIAEVNFLNRNKVYFLKEADYAGYWPNVLYYRVYKASADAASTLSLSVKNWPKTGNPPPAPDPIPGLPPVPEPGGSGSGSGSTPTPTQTPPGGSLPLTPFSAEDPAADPSEDPAEATEAPDADTDVDPNGETDNAAAPAPLPVIDFTLNYGEPDAVLDMYDEMGNFVQRRITDENGVAVYNDIPHGNYTIYLYDPESDGPGTPVYYVTIDESEVPLAVPIFSPRGEEADTPKTGDESIPSALLLLVMAACLAGIVLVLRKNRKFS